ncbi:MAG: MFS transporter [Acidobacteria bacterium]|nr:MFS transporter [Acidobacteriota bacterium]MBS1864967.1 MFS transporter [Acidobacteriota bacterium]
MANSENASSRGLGPLLIPVILLHFAIFINYIDRSNLSLAGTTIQNELHLSSAQLGFLLSAFFYTYSGCLFFVGWFTDRFNVNYVLGFGFLIWSAATAATGLARGFAVLFSMRLLLGVGESVAFPSFAKVLAKYVPEHARGIANGIIIAGMRTGPAVGTLAGGLLIAKYGWRPVFIGIGLISLLWLPLWLLFSPRGPGLPRPAAPQSAPPTTLDIFAQRSFWGVTLGHFCSNYFVYFMLTWLPIYLIQARHLTPQSMPKIAALYYLVDALSTMACGWASDHFIRSGRSVTFVRKSAMVIGSSIVALALIASLFASQSTYLPWLLILGVGSGIGGMGIFAFCQTMAGHQATGRWAGLQNAFANFAGIICPAVTGILLGKTDGFAWPLVIVAAVVIVGIVSWIFIVGPVREIDWHLSARNLPETALPSAQSSQ